MGMSNNGWVRRRTALLLSATLAVSPVLAVPAFATQDGDAPSPIEQSDNQTTDQGGEKNPQAEKDPQAEKTPEVEKDPQAEPKTGGVAQVVETGGNITSYPSLTDAVEAVNRNGGTLKLLKSASENIIIKQAGVKVTAAESVVYSGSLTLAENCTVENMSFTNPGSTEVSKGFSNCINMADGATVTNCTFTVPSGVWAKKSEGYMWWQPNCISVNGKQDCTIELNTFNLGRINEKNADGTIADSDSHVAINLIGPNVSNITIANNTMNVTAPVPEATVGGGICFVFSSGNQNSAPAYGVSGVKLENNTFNGSGDPTNARFAGFSDSDGLIIKGNTVSNAATGVYQGSYLTKTASSSIEEMVGNNIDAPSNLVKANVTVDGHTYSFSSVTDAINSARSNNGTVQLTQSVTESVTIPANKTVTLDLAGHTLTNTEGEHTVTVAKGATLAVTDSSADKAGVIDNVSHGKAALFNDQGGTVVLNGGTFNRSRENGSSAVQSGGNSFYTLQNYGSMTINEGVTVRQGSNEEGGKFSSLIENGWYNGKLNTSKDEATMVINGGSFVGGLNTIKNDDWGVLTINGGSFTNTAQAAVLNWNKTTIKGGEFQSDQYAVLNGKLDDSMDVGELVIEGGSFKGGNGYKVVSQMSSSTPIGSVAISGGEFWTAPDEEFIVPGSGLTQNSDGSFVIHEHIGTAVAAKDPTCTEAGNKAYWECSECHELFLDEAMTQPTTREYVTIAATGHQHVTHVEAKDATKTEAGNLEYWFCADCGRYFLDEALTKVATLADVTIPATGTAEPEEPSDEKPAEGEKGDGLAQTGDPSAVAPLAAAAAAGAGALLGALRLRRRDS